MPLPTPSLSPQSGVEVTSRQSIDIFVAIARFDERIARLIDTLSDDRRAREKDREGDRAEVSALATEISQISARLTTQETERIADKRAFGVWRVVASSAFAALTAAVGAGWFALKH